MSGPSSVLPQLVQGTELTSLDTKTPALLSVAPGSDTGQAAVPVRVISQLGAGGGAGGGLTDTQLRATPVPVSGTVSVSGTVTTSGPLTDTQLRAAAVPVSLATAPTTPVTNAGLTNLDVALSTRLKPADTLAAVTTVGAVTAITNPLPAGTNTIGTVNVQPSTLVATTLSTAATTVTLTLAAAGASLFHYITRIEIVRVSTAAVTGSAVLSYTSTNLPGSWTRSAGNAIAIGATVKDVDDALASPLKSSAANVATTIIAPSGGAGVQVRITVYYYTGT